MKKIKPVAIFYEDVPNKEFDLKNRDILFRINLEERKVRNAPKAFYDLTLKLNEVINAINEISENLNLKN